MSTRVPKTIHFWRGDLPHWQVEDGRYFVTVHLKDAIPVEGQNRIRGIARQIRAERESLNSVEENLELTKMSRKIFQEMERWLDHRPNNRLFELPELALMVVDAVKHRMNNATWNVFEFVVMPSHFHMFFEIDNEKSLKKELEEFKRWTGHQATKIKPSLKASRFWQTEWFDHWSRSDEQDQQIIEYIRNNPVEAKLVEKSEDWPFRGSLGS